MKKIGNFNIISVLGDGATSTVYLALDPFTGDQVALKVFNLSTLNNPSLAKTRRKLLLTEASLVGKLSHPHIVKIFNAVMDGEDNYIVMEYVAGITLEHHTEMAQLLPFGAISEIIYKCCKALEYAQHKGVIHRDIKPANILLGNDAHIRISDFGSAIVSNRDITLVNGVGSLAYMSPEQVDDQVMTHQTDIYSLGVTLFQLLTGKLPFEANNNLSLVYQIMNTEPPLPSSFRPEVPPQLDAIVQRAMHRDLSQRYPTWDAFAQDVVSYFKQSLITQTEIFDMEKFGIVRSLGFFRNFSDIELWEVLHFSRWRKMNRGGAIITEGGAGREFYILGQGEASVLVQGNVLSTLHTGDCFGEMSHLSEHAPRRTTDVMALSDVTLIEINPDILEKASAECRFQFDRAILRLLANRLSVANARISCLLSA